MDKERMQQLAGLTPSKKGAGEAWMDNRKAKILAIRNDIGTYKIVFLPFDKYNNRFGTNYTNKGISADLYNSLDREDYPASQAIEAGTRLLPQEQVGDWTKLVKKVDTYLITVIPNDQYSSGEELVVGVLMR